MLGSRGLSLFTGGAERSGRIGTVPKERFLLAAVALLAVTLFWGCAPKRVETVQLEEGRNVIKRIESEELEGKTRITIEAENPVRYTAFKLADPLRVVVDISEADISGFREPVSVDNGTVGDIVTTQFGDEESNIGRVEIFLDRVTDYNIEKDKNVLYVMIDSVAEAAEQAPAPEDVVAESSPEAEETGSEELTAEGEGVVGDVQSEEVPANRAEYIADIVVEEDEEEVRVIARGEGYIGDYNSFRLENPDRIVVDIIGVTNLYRKNSIDVDSPLLNSVRVGQHPGRVRLVLDPPADASPKYSIGKSGKMLTVTLGEDLVEEGHVSVAAAGEVPAEVAEEPAMEKVEIATITGIDFKQMPDASRVAITASDIVEYEVKELTDLKVALDLRGTSVPRNLQRSLDTTEFDTPVQLISSYQLSRVPENVVRVIVALRDESPYEVIQEEERIFIDFDREVEGEVMPEVVAEVVEEAPAPPEKVEVEEEAAPLAGAAEEMVEGEGRRYTGQRVSLDYKDADIGNILRLFAEVSGFNIIATEDVKGTVTIKLDNVPWDQALDIILEAKQLGQTKIGNVLRIAPAAKLKKEEEAALAAKKAKEKLEELVTATIPVNHMPLTDMEGLVKDLLTERGKVKSIKWTSSLRVTDIEKNIEIIRQEIESNDLPVRQVLIEARIVEVDTNFAKDLGVQWGGQYTADAAHGNALGYNFPNSMTVGAGAGGSFALNAPSAGNTGTGASGGGAGGTVGFNFGSIDNTISLDLKLSALESKGVSKVISRPRIVTMNGKQAIIEQGFSIPFETTSAEGTQTEFIDANLNLTVTPEIKRDNIILEIKAAKNEPDFARTGAGGAPSISKKEASTEVMIRDGDTTVIGGIFTQKKGNSEAGVPFLSKIPVIGWLFKSTKKSDDKAELLIFITPRIVKDI